MAQIVKSERGYWVGKELYKGEQYISFDAVRFHHPIEKIVVVSIDELAADILKHFSISVLQQTPKHVINTLASELCNSEIGMVYLLDYRAPFGVRKIIDAPCYA